MCVWVRGLAKGQLVPLLQAAMHHPGFALIDVLSPCVTFNDHEGSTRSYAYTREHYEEVVHADFVPHAPEIAVSPWICRLVPSKITSTILPVTSSPPTRARPFH